MVYNIHLLEILVNIFFVYWTYLPTKTILAVLPET